MTAREMTPPRAPARVTADDRFDRRRYPPDIERTLQRNCGRPDWFREQLQSFALHIKSSAPYNQDQLARALAEMAEGREWEVMTWR